MPVLMKMFVNRRTSIMIRNGTNNDLGMDGVEHANAD